MHPLAIAYEWTERNRTARGAAAVRRSDVWAGLARRVPLAGGMPVTPPLPEVTDVPRPVLPAGPS